MVIADDFGRELRVGDFINIYDVDEVILAKIVGMVPVFNNEEMIVVTEIDLDDECAVEVFQYGCGEWQTFGGQIVEIKKLIREDESGVKVINMFDVKDSNIGR